MARAPAQRDERARDRAGAEGGEHVAEDGEVAVLFARDDRADDEQRRERDEQRDAERRERRPDPRARAHLGEAGPHLGAQRCPVARVRARRPAAFARVHADEQGGAEEERRRVDGKRRRRAQAEHEPRRNGGTGELREVGEHRRHRVGLLDLGLGHGLRQQPTRGGAVERLGCAEQHADRHEVPDADLAGHDQQSEQRVQREPREVGHDHEQVARQAVGDDAADKQEADHRQAVRGEDEAKIGRACSQVDHEQGERDPHDVVAQRARRVGEPQQAKVAVAKDAQVFAQGGHGDIEVATGTALPSPGFEPAATPRRGSSPRPPSAAR